MEGREGLRWFKKKHLVGPVVVHKKASCVGEARIGLRPVEGREGLWRSARENLVEKAK